MDKVFKINATATSLFWVMVVVILIIYLIKQKNKNAESSYLFLNGSYFINEPYVDSYPQY